MLAEVRVHHPLSAAVVEFYAVRPVFGHRIVQDYAHIGSVEAERAYLLLRLDGAVALHLLFSDPEKEEPACGSRKGGSVLQVAHLRDQIFPGKGFHAAAHRPLAAALFLREIVGRHLPVEHAALEIGNTHYDLAAVIREVKRRKETVALEQRLYRDVEHRAVRVVELNIARNAVLFERRDNAAGRNRSAVQTSLRAAFADFSVLLIKNLQGVSGAVRNDRISPVDIDDRVLHLKTRGPVGLVLFADIADAVLRILEKTSLEGLVTDQAALTHILLVQHRIGAVTLPPVVDVPRNQHRKEAGRNPYQSAPVLFQRVCFTRHL